MKSLRPVEPRAFTARDEARYELGQFGWPDSALWVVPCLVSPETDPRGLGAVPNRARLTELWNAYEVCADVTGTLLFLLERLTVRSNADDTRSFTDHELREFLHACRQNGVDLRGAMGRFCKQLCNPARIAALLSDES